MLRDHRSFVAVLATGLMTIGVVSFAGTAVAAVPDNDTQAGAVAITGLPFSFTQDTTEATVDAGEDVAKNYCFESGAPAFEHAVWFKATVAPGGTTQSIAFDVTQSDYGAGIAVLQDTASGLVALACVPGTFIAGAGGAAGTYYFVVFGDGTTPATGGNLVFTVAVAPSRDLDDHRSGRHRHQRGRRMDLGDRDMHRRRKLGASPERRRSSHPDGRASHHHEHLLHRRPLHRATAAPTRGRPTPHQPTASSPVARP